MLLLTLLSVGLCPSDHETEIVYKLGPISYATRIAYLTNHILVHLIAVIRVGEEYELSSSRLCPLLHSVLKLLWFGFT
jgi:hypothetical protein